MKKRLMLYAGSAVIILWGIAYIAIPTKDIIEGSGPISMDNKRILAIQCIMAGVSFYTGVRTSIIPMRLCLPIFPTLAVFFWLGSVV